MAPMIGRTSTPLLPSSEPVQRDKWLAIWGANMKSVNTLLLCYTNRPLQTISPAVIPRFLRGRQE